MKTTPLPNETANELYAMLSPELRTEFAQYAQSVTVPQGTNLLKRGVLPDQLVIVNSGKVEITLACMRRSVSLGCAEAGKVFGMRAVISGELPEADVISQEICQITLIPRDAFLKTVRQHPQLYFAIAKVLSNDLVLAQRFLKNSLGRPLRRKIIAKPFLTGLH
jgi:CRP/FNR family transcriptional regulator, cyclic AMP receptor protein